MENETPYSLSRRISVHASTIPTLTPVTPPISFQKKVAMFASSTWSIILMIIRESTSFCALALIVSWISYFITAINRDTLFMLNGVFIGLIILSALLRRQYMLSELRERDRRERRRRIYGTGFIRSSTNPVNCDDESVILKIRSVYVKYLMQHNVESGITLKDTTEDCTSCVICLVDFDPSDPLVGLNCQHVFHSSCLTDWLITQVSTTAAEVCPSCPTCRNRLYMNDEAMKSFVDEVCAPGFINSRNLSHQVNVVFNHYRQSTVNQDV